MELNRSSFKNTILLSTIFFESLPTSQPEDELMFPISVARLGYVNLSPAGSCKGRKRSPRVDPAPGIAPRKRGRQQEFLSELPQSRVKFPRHQTLASPPLANEFPVLLY